MATRAAIAVVDDDAAVREALEGLLRSAGFPVLLFASGEEFLASVRTSDTACLVLDVRMSGMSGLELQDQLNAAGIHIPIVFMTAHADSSVQARALAAGATEFLQKPFDDEELLAAVARALGSSGP